MGKAEEASREDSGGYLIGTDWKLIEKEEEASREDSGGFLIEV